MSVLNYTLPAVSSLVSFVSAVLVLRRFALKGGAHLLLWGLGIILYGVGGLCEAFYGVFGWSSVAHVLMSVLLAGSIYAAVRVLTAAVDPALMTSSLHTGSELSGHAIVTPVVRVLTPFFNLYGTIALVGGALWSAFVFWRKRVLLHRTLGSVLIAAGALLPAFGGTFSRMGIPNALYIGELLGAILILLGFLRATTPMRSERVK